MTLLKLRYNRRSSGWILRWYNGSTNVRSKGGYLQDKSDRVTTERLREKINGASTAYADIKNTNIYEQEEYTNPETGEVGFKR